MHYSKQIAYLCNKHCNTECEDTTCPYPIKGLIKLIASEFRTYKGRDKFPKMQEILQQQFESSLKCLFSQRRNWVKKERERVMEFPVGIDSRDIILRNPSTDDGPYRITVPRETPDGIAAYLPKGHGHVVAPADEPRRASRMPLRGRRSKPPLYAGQVT